MSRKGTHWDRHWLYGTRTGVELSEQSVRAARDAGCDLYAPRSLAAVFDIETLAYLDEEIIPRAIRLGCHFVPLIDAKGERVGWATHTDSAECTATIWYWFTSTTHGENFVTGERRFRVHGPNR